MFSKKHTGLLFVMFSEEHTGLLFVMFSKKHTGLLFVMFSKEHTGLLFVMFSKETNYEVEMPKMFDTNNDRCPVKIFQFLIIKPPVNLEISGLFYLTIITNSIFFTWFWKSPISIQKRNNIMNTVTSNTPFQTSKNRLTNQKPLTITTKRSISDVAAALDPPLPIILHEKH